jgi:5-methylcytosine-specific restriction protein A
MVRRYGAAAAAKQLLVSGDIQYGFRRLVEEGRPDLTVEWSVLLPRWHSLFSELHRDAARWRLQQAGVDPTDTSMRPE